MISTEEFSTMKMSKKIRTLYGEGIFIVAIRYYKYKINLYLLSDFYIEVFYNPKLDRIDKVEPLIRPTKRMKFYADQIKLPSDLLS